MGEKRNSLRLARSEQRVIEDWCKNNEQAIKDGKVRLSDAVTLLRGVIGKPITNDHVKGGARVFGLRFKRASGIGRHRSVAMQGRHIVLCGVIQSLAEQVKAMAVALDVKVTPEVQELATDAFGYVQRVYKSRSLEEAGDDGR